MSALVRLGPPSSRSMIGITNAAVLPVPVIARPMMSRPFSASGTACAWIGVGRWYFKELMDKGGAAILQHDAAVCGGITEWRRIAATAASYGVTVCPHWFHDLHVHLVASTPNARMVEYFTDDQVLNFRRLIDRQLEFKDGMLRLPMSPGPGFAFDKKAVARYSLGGKTSPWTLIRN